MDLSSIKVLFIDVDDTLYSYKEQHQKAILKCYEEFKKVDSSLTFEEFNFKYREARDSVTDRLKPTGACRSREFAFLEMFEELKIDRAYILANDFTNIYWDSFYKNMKLFNNVLKILQEAKAKGIVTCAITDMLHGVQVRKLKALKVTNYIDFLVSSEEVGFEKPSEKIYNLAFKKVSHIVDNLKEEEVLMIGDSEKKDYNGAIKMGFKAYLIK